jgi:hypothetical protein
MCRRIEQSFASHPESVRAARRLLAATLRAWGVDDRDAVDSPCSNILLVASELSTNAIKSKSKDFRLAITVHRHYAEVEVEDRDPTPVKPRRAGPHDSSGRGLSIVAALSTRWGQELHGDLGKKVWSRVPLPGGSAVCEDCFP